MQVRAAVSVRPKRVNEETMLAMPCLYRFSAEHSPLPMIATEGRTHIVRYANPAFCRLFARARAELLGRPFAEIIPEREQSPCLALLDRVYLSQNAEEAIEQKHLTAEGETVYWTYLAWPAFDEKEELAGVMLQVTDATEAIRARQHFEQVDEEIRAINQELLIADIREQEIAEREASAQQQLHHAQRMEGIGKLAGGIAHDFNNLLTAILGFTELAANSLPPEEPVQRHLHTIQSAAERAATLTSQLLAFARKQVIVPRVLDINVLIGDIDTMLQRLIGEDIELVSLPQPDAGRVKVDPGQFGQVLINLVVNACDAMPAGGRLTIETAAVTLDEDDAHPHEGVAPGDYVLMTVRDTGTGMTEEVQAHLFEPFYTTKPQGKGTGLGLATCYGIVRQNGGHIQVDSASGAGTTVRIYLPRVEEARPCRHGKSVQLPSLPQATGTILLVEDEALVRDIGTQALRLQGYTVLAAEDGEEALQVLRQHPGEIDLVVTDLVMPVMGGRELADRLHKTHPHLKVLFISGYTDDTIVRRGILEPGAAFIQKPFTPTDLARKVRELLDIASG
jgi:PAS domain S-box-containing protein